MMKPQQQRELMDLMISKNKSLADAAATYMMNEKNIQLLSAMQLHNQTIMQYKQQQRSSSLADPASPADIVGQAAKSLSTAGPMAEEASQRKSSYVDAGGSNIAAPVEASQHQQQQNRQAAKSTSAPAGSRSAKQMFSTLLSDSSQTSPSAPSSSTSVRSQFNFNSANRHDTDSQQTAPKSQGISSMPKRVPKLLMKPMRPAKYSLNGYIPKPSLSLLSKDLVSTS